MNCEHAENLIAAQIAGELRPEEQVGLEEHLRDCAGCAQLKLDWEEDDRRLREGFAVWKSAKETVATRTIRQLHREQRTAPSPKPLSSWIPFLVGLAAGVLLMLAAWRPWNAPQVTEVIVPKTRVTDVPAPTPSAPVLASVVGAVEYRPHTEDDWTVAQTGAEIPLGCTLRTQADSLCEFVGPSGETARVGVDTQLRVPASNKVELVSGQVWACAPAHGEMCVQTDSGSILTQGGAVNVSRRPKEMIVTAASGDALVRLVNNEERLVAGEEMAIEGQLITRRDRAYSLALITAWMNPLLALKSPDDPELNAHVDALLSHLGETKMTLLSDKELRALGPSCTVPLSRFVRTASPAEQREARRHAAQLLADLAPISLAGDMIELLSDEDGEVRARAAECLERLTGQDMELPAEQWRAAPDEPQRKAIERWQNWWQANSFRCQPAPKSQELNPKIKA